MTRAPFIASALFPQNTRFVDNKSEQHWRRNRTKDSNYKPLDSEREWSLFISYTSVQKDFLSLKYSLKFKKMTYRKVAESAGIVATKVHTITQKARTTNGHK